MSEGVDEKQLMRKLIENERERWEAVRSHQKKHGIATVLIAVLMSLGLIAEIVIGAGFLAVAAGCIAPLVFIGVSQTFAL